MVCRYDYEFHGVHRVIVYYDRGVLSFRRRSPALRDFRFSNNFSTSDFLIRFERHAFIPDYTAVRVKMPSCFEIKTPPPPRTIISSLISHRSQTETNLYVRVPIKRLGRELLSDERRLLNALSFFRENDRKVRRLFIETYFFGNRERIFHNYDYSTYGARLKTVYDV